MPRRSCRGQCSLNELMAASFLAMSLLGSCHLRYHNGYNSVSTALTCFLRAACGDGDSEPPSLALGTRERGLVEGLDTGIAVLQESPRRVPRRNKLGSLLLRFLSIKLSAAGRRRVTGQHQGTKDPGSAGTCVTVTALVLTGWTVNSNYPIEQ